MIIEQLKDLRLRTLPNGSLDKATMTDYTLISIMLGELYTRNNKVYFNMPEWDFMCERPTIKTKIPYRYALAMIAIADRYKIDNPRRVFKDQGFPCLYNRAYSSLVVEGKDIDLDMKVEVNDRNFSTVAIKAKLFTGRYNDIFIDSVFNPFITWLDYYEKGIVLNPENIIYNGSPVPVSEDYIRSIQQGYNPELNIYMKQPFNIMTFDPRIRHVYCKDINIEELNNGETLGDI